MSEGTVERDVMEYDVVVVGAGPAGLAAAIRLKQRAAQAGKELNVCVVEKGSEVGAHILSGAILDPRALQELLPDWKKDGAPISTAVVRDDVYLLRSANKAVKLPNLIVPKTMHNTGRGNYIISLGRLVRWLGEQAEALGVEIYPGFAAQEVIVEGDEPGVVRGIVTGDMGVARDGSHKDSYTPGMELRAKYTLFAEGCRGHLGKRLLKRYGLDRNVDTQHYGLGIKELWEVPAAQSVPGLVVHGAGWPLDDENPGGFFLYHEEQGRVAVGLIVDLSYSNPFLSPYDEFQRLKHHPVISQYLLGGKRIAYGARTLTKGGYNSLPKMTFPGGMLIGDDAGTMNFSKIKGNHTAMKSGMLAAETVADALLSGGEGGADLNAYAERFRDSWLQTELYRSRNFGGAIHRYGSFLGNALNYIDQNWFGGRAPWTLHDRIPDYARLKLAAESERIDYPKPDGKLSFDKMSSVYLSSTNHEEDQPVHLHLKDLSIPIRVNLPKYDEPAQRYCPAGVYEIVGEGENRRLQINFQNCVHCKACDIKDPSQNITWVAPEGGGGPNYSAM